MRVAKLYAMVCLCFIVALPATAGIWVSAPGSANVSKSGTATATSPVHFLAIASSPACSKGVSQIAIYTTSNSPAYSVNGSSLDASLALNAGTYNVTVQESDNCGWSSKANVQLTVTGSASGNPPLLRQCHSPICKTREAGQDMHCSRRAGEFAPPVLRLATN